MLATARAHTYEPQTLDLQLPRQPYTPAPTLVPATSPRIAHIVALGLFIAVIAATITTIAQTPAVPIGLRAGLNNVLSSAGAAVVACVIMSWRLNHQTSTIQATARTLTNSVAIDLGQVAAGQEQTGAQVARIVSALRSRRGEDAVDGTVLGDLVAWMGHIDASQRQTVEQFRPMIKEALKEAYNQGRVDAVVQRSGLRPVN